MKNLLSIIALSAVVMGSASAQTSLTGSKLTLTSNSGTYITCKTSSTSPYNEMFYVSANGTAAATALKLSVDAANHTYSPNLNISYNSTATDSNPRGWIFNTSSYGGNRTVYPPVVFKTEEFVIKNGNLKVEGKISCQDELKVASIDADNIITKDINVEMNNAADYVFDANYNLKSLSEVESYVNEHHHLPGIPSANEMAENGMSVAKMSNLLLEKVEELTLHMIQLEKENAQLKATVESLRK
ncbi:MAG: hypothetical protein MJZ19_08305 [Paludibacteraceae bacterium]|nr:hypothetical protein [Paludibacteraceae bacterium]